MREIKFRGKCVNTGEWVYGFLWGSIDPCKKNTEYRSWHIYQGISIAEGVQVDPDSIGQFIGYRDDDGAEIYDNDIARVSGNEYYSNDSLSIDGEWEYTGKVEFNSMMYLVGNKEYIPFCDIMSDQLGIKVIGNMTDTPELLS